VAGRGGEDPLSGADRDADVTEVVDGYRTSVEDEVAGANWFGSPIDGAAVLGL